MGEYPRLYRRRPRDPELWRLPRPDGQPTVGLRGRSGAQSSQRVRFEAASPNWNLPFCSHSHNMFQGCPGLAKLAFVWRIKLWVTDIQDHRGWNRPQLSPSGLPSLVQFLVWRRKFAFREREKEKHDPAPVSPVVLQNRLICAAFYRNSLSGKGIHPVVPLSVFALLVDSRIVSYVFYLGPSFPMELGKWHIVLNS